MLPLKISRETPLISSQCKREKHGKKKEEIMGQEFAHLLGATIRKKKIGKRLEDGVDYTVGIYSLSLDESLVRRGELIYEYRHICSRGIILLPT